MPRRHSRNVDNKRYDSELLFNNARTRNALHNALGSGDSALVPKCVDPKPERNQPAWDCESKAATSSLTSFSTSTECFAFHWHQVVKASGFRPGPWRSS